MALLCVVTLERRHLGKCSFPQEQSGKDIMKFDFFTYCGLSKLWFTGHLSQPLIVLNSRESLGKLLQGGSGDSASSFSSGAQNGRLTSGQTLGLCLSISDTEKMQKIRLGVQSWFMLPGRKVCGS